jgi:hypothetical protein
MSQKFSKTRTTYCASTHPKWQNNPTQSGVLRIPISIITTPAPTYQDLCAMRDELSLCFSGAAQLSDPDPVVQDKREFMQALTCEIGRCKPDPWLQNQTTIHPTQHAYIDPDQVKQLEGILKPETLRRTFISINALIHEIQKDMSSNC